MQTPYCILSLGMGVESMLFSFAGSQNRRPGHAPSIV
jgi:hypothetical protein